MSGEQLRKAYESGKTLAALARLQGVHPRDVRKAIVAAGGEIRPNGPVPKEERRKMAAA